MPTDENNYEENPELESGKLKETVHLSQMYQSWFLDYASYVILERAVPEITDGLKPVQRRILHAMRELDDGRYNKVANIIGHTMKYHPHGDASIGDALVQLGQKDLLIDCLGAVENAEVPIEHWGVVVAALITSDSYNGLRKATLQAEALRLQQTERGVQR